MYNMNTVIKMRYLLYFRICQRIDIYIGNYLAVWEVKQSEYYNI